MDFRHHLQDALRRRVNNGHTEAQLLRRSLMAFSPSLTPRLWGEGCGGRVTIGWGTLALENDAGALILFNSCLGLFVLVNLRCFLNFNVMHDAVFEQ